MSIAPEAERWLALGLDSQMREAVGKVLIHAAATFGTAEKAERWLRRPNPVLGSTPLDEIVKDPESVDDELTRIDHGVYV